MYLTTTTPLLRLRNKPSLESDKIGLIRPTDLILSLENDAIVINKIGQEGQWVNVEVNGKNGYAAAWYLALQSFRGKLLGVNVDLLSNLTFPSPELLGDLQYARFEYNVSFNPLNQTFGNLDIHLTEQLYRPKIMNYIEAGITPIMILGHRTYGEGQKYNWNTMEEKQWLLLIDHLAQMAKEIAKRYGNKVIYQVWNQQDVIPGSADSVAVPAALYGKMLSRVSKLIKSVCRDARIITGGFVTGQNALYWKQVMTTLDVINNLSGVAIHPYGLGSNNSRYAPFGHIKTLLGFWARMTALPVYITEWGVLDLPNENPAEVGNYASAMIKYIKEYTEVKSLIWYPYRDGMHNGYGLIDRDGNKKKAFWDRYKE